MREVSEGNSAGVDVLGTGAEIRVGRERFGHGMMPDLPAHSFTC